MAFDTRPDDDDRTLETDPPKKRNARRQSFLPEQPALTRAWIPSQVVLLTVIVGNLLLKSLDFSAMLTATLRAIAL